MSRRFSFPRVTMENMNQKPGPHLGGRSVGCPAVDSEVRLCGGLPVISHPGKDFPWMPGFCNCLFPGGPCPASLGGSRPCCPRLAMMTADGTHLGGNPVIWNSVSNPQSSPGDGVLLPTLQMKKARPHIRSMSRALLLESRLLIHVRS